MHGTTLRLPREFFNCIQEISIIDPTSYVSQAIMQDLQSPPVHDAPQRKVHISDALASCTHVLVRQDSVRKPLQTPYDGPYKILKRQDKYFTIDIRNKAETVSLDRLKPAHLDSAADTNPPPHPVSQPPQPTNTSSPSRIQMPCKPTITRYGCHVHWPVHLDL